MLSPTTAIYYTRFADDFLVVLCNASKAEAIDLKDCMAEWLQQTLGLTLNMDKTLVTLARTPSLLGLSPSRTTF